MTVSTTNTKHIYAGTGLSTSFDFDFPVTDGAQIRVYLTNPAGVVSLLETGYNVNVDEGRVQYPYTTEVDENGDPVPVTPLPDGWKLTILRVVDLTQEVDLRNQGAFNSEVLEQAYDKATMILQQQQEVLSRCVKYPVDQNPTSTETEQFLSDVNASKSAAQTAASAAAAAQAGAESAKTSAETASTAAQAAKTAAETAATSASSSASSASSSATAAAGSATAAAGSAATAGTKATEAASSASAAASSATAAGTSASSAATSASTATTKAGEAAASASAANDAVTGFQAQLDAHTGDTANPHGVTKTQVGLGNVQDLDQTDPANITEDATHRFATDAEKTLWNAQDALKIKGVIVNDAAKADKKVLQYDSATDRVIYADAAGGGGGGSLQWVEADNAPLSAVENGMQVYLYEKTPVFQQLFTTIRVPSTYVAGKPIKLYLPCYSPDASGTWALSSVSTLIKAGLSEVSTTGFTNPSGPGSVTMTVDNQNILLSRTFEVTTSTGTIGLQDVAPGDLIKVMIYRSGGSAAKAVRILPYSAEVTFQ